MIQKKRSASERLAQAAARKIARLTSVSEHDFALTLGSGWAKAADLIGETIAEFPAHAIPGFGKSHVAGHRGTIRSILLPNDKHALVLGSRTHLYEGKGLHAVVHSVRTAAACGAKIMILTNGAGGIKPSWGPGTPVLISDHINLTGCSPLDGPAFIDLTDLYSARLREIAKNIDPGLNEGIYVQFRGPNYETPAEIGMAKKIGGHIVGMSTALEAISAREAGMEVLGLSLVTNLAAGISGAPLNHSEVLDAGMAAEPALSALLSKIVWAL